MSIETVGAITLDHDALGRLLIFGEVLCGDVKIVLGPGAVEAAKETVKMADRMARLLHREAMFYGGS